MNPYPILIVEDDDNIAQLLGFMFSREGFEPLLFHDGRAAEEYVSTHQPAAAALLDIMLPYRDGFAVATAIRADSRWSSVPIVVLSAKSLEADVERGRRAGIQHWVSKPFHPGALVGQVKDLIRDASP